MKEAILIAEFIILGIIAVASLFFPVLILLGIRDLNFLSKYEQYKEILSIFMIAICYLLGAICHRSGFALMPLFESVSKKMNFSNYNKYITNIYSMRLKSLYIRQWGSSQVNDYIEYLRRQLLLFRTAWILLFVFSFSFSSWMLFASMPLSYCVVSFCCPLLVCILTFIAYIKQAHIYKSSLDEAYLIVNKSASENQDQ